MRYAQRAMRKFIPVMKNDKLNLWRAVYAERCKYGFRREYGTVEVGDRLCLPHDLDIQVSKLQLLKQSFLSQRYEMEDKVTKYYPMEIKKQSQWIVEYQQDIEQVKAHTPPDRDTFPPMQINGVTYREKKEAGHRQVDVSHYP